METTSSAIIQAPPDRRRWLILGTVGLAQLMVVLDTAIVNIALPSAQRALGFSTADRQWVVTAYALAFGSLLLLGGRLGDLIGRKTTFLAGALGFAAASAVGGAATSFGMLIAARATQGAFGALLAPAALSILSTTFSDPKERGKAFGVYGAIVGAGGAIGLVLGGILTEYLSWRWCLYVNLFFAGLAVIGAVMLLRHQSVGTRPRLDLPGAVAVSASMFCLVYGFSNAANHSWDTPSTYGFLATGVALLAGFAFWQARAASPLLPVPHLLHAADAWLLPGGQRRRVPAGDRDGGGGRQPVKRGAAAPVRPQAAGHRRDAAGRWQPGVADQDRGALEL
jgi:MFS family permease